jgi:AcrR family transcriptional regulator
VASNSRALRGPRRPWPDRERGLLDALERLLLAEGFGHLRVSDLTRRLHISRSTVYRLARDRQSLFEMAAARILGRAEGRAMEAAENAGTTAAAIAAYLATIAEPVRVASPAFLRDLAANMGTRAILERHRLTSQKVLATLIDNGVKEGAFRPVTPALVAQLVDVAMERLRDPAALDGTGMTYAEAVEELADVMLRGIVVGDAGCLPTSPAPLASGRGRRSGQR